MKQQRNIAGVCRSGVFGQVQGLGELRRRGRLRGGERCEVGHFQIGRPGLGGLDAQGF